MGGRCGAELDKWVKPEDTVETEIQGIGTLKKMK
jgi:2-keto-4-pentenoate hydratase/2-oxohepta-3-ene-1,7-dioic acid hydratase in catechol pathway